MGEKNQRDCGCFGSSKKTSMGNTVNLEGLYVQSYTRLEFWRSRIKTNITIAWLWQNGYQRGRRGEFLSFSKLGCKDQLSKGMVEFFPFSFWLLTTRNLWLGLIFTVLLNFFSPHFDSWLMEIYNFFVDLTLGFTYED